MESKKFSTKVTHNLSLSADFESICELRRPPLVLDLKDQSGNRDSIADKRPYAVDWNIIMRFSEFHDEIFSNSLLTVENIDYVLGGDQHSRQSKKVTLFPFKWTSSNNEHHVSRHLVLGRRPPWVSKIRPNH
jgi:hypothetical protein